MISDVYRPKPHQLQLVDLRPKSRRPVSEVPILGCFASGGSLYLRVKADKHLTYEEAKHRISVINLADGSRAEFPGESAVDVVESVLQITLFKEELCP